MNDCPGCRNLAPMGIRCNAHRTASRTTELLARAEKAGHVLPAGTRAQRGLAAEKALGARGRVMNP